MRTYYSCNVQYLLYVTFILKEPRASRAKMYHIAAWERRRPDRTAHAQSDQVYYVRYVYVYFLQWLVYTETALELDCVAVYVESGLGIRMCARKESTFSFVMSHVSICLTVVEMRKMIPNS